MSGSPEVKDRIITAARVSFYEHGYIGTTYSALAKSLELSPGSLTYHFPSKAELGSAVHGQFVHEYHVMIRDWLMEHYGFYSPLMDFILQIRVGMKMYDEDEKAYRFYYEYARNDFEKFLVSGPTPFFPPYLKKDDLNIDEDEPALFAAAYRAIAVALNFMYLNDGLSTDFDFFVDYKIRTMLTFARVPAPTVEKMVEESRRYYEEMDIEVLPEFKLITRG